MQNIDENDVKTATFIKRELAYKKKILEDNLTISESFNQEIFLTNFFVRDTLGQEITLKNNKRSKPHVIYMPGTGDKQ